MVLHLERALGPLVPAGRVAPSGSLNYSPDPANLGHARGERYAGAMGAVYAGCFELLRPGGLLVVVTKNTRRGGRLDLALLTSSWDAVPGLPGHGPPP